MSPLGFGGNVRKSPGIPSGGNFGRHVDQLLEIIFPNLACGMGSTSTWVHGSTGCGTTDAWCPN